jgi:DNA modification methylase
MDIWNDCYQERWQGKIYPLSICHPAKFSRGLIKRIYEHAIEEGWVSRGDNVLDPFGGVALGALDAITNGLNWTGVELEEKFVKLGEKNISYWKERMRGNYGTARIIQGDSRNIKNIIEKVDLVVSSPPYSDSLSGSDKPQDHARHQELATKAGHGRIGCGQLRYQNAYGRTKGNLSIMKEGDIDIVVSSPPYAESCGVGLAPTGTCFGDGASSKLQKESGKDASYGQTPGQLGNKIDIVVSSPPYEGMEIRSENQIIGGEKMKELRKNKNWEGYNKQNKDNMGNITGDTFWSASREIVQGCYDLLKPNGHAIWVCKDYIKKGQRIPFSDRWLALCESVGFKLVCRHRGMLVSGNQQQWDGNIKKKEVKSFFRRLQESKGAPKIDWEDVICVVK